MQVTPELIRKYHLGQCSPEEENAVLQWLAGDGTDQVPSYLKGNERKAIQSRIWNALGDGQRHGEDSGKATRNTVCWKWSRIAAGVAMVAGLSWLAYDRLAMRKNAMQIAPIHYQEIRAAFGEKKKFYLPDSSLVYLNAGSHLRFPDHFTDTSRNVQLTGEAFFEISKDPSRPFTIHTQNTETRVLGTVFNLKAYPGELTELVVTEGKVRFGKAQKQVVLTANQMASFDVVSGELSNRNVYAGAYAGWKQNRLVFRDNRLSEIAVILERWYRIDIEIRGPGLERVIFTGTYENPSLQTILHDMSSAMKFTYTQQGKQLIIQ
ncbi:FecR family protein [Dyadobacter jiangsuensis]|uniref:FecR family protein n=1 Tax=Dyadobacter jiangsuensis TaxID=1591085 RepID=A0A2P8G068_9BACT|nr:FecR domain-containing protein [Dyadobacter jiangsuensis]PSL27370.1 FecR family protein [Dyadobacter jiangsuensis]